MRSVPSLRRWSEHFLPTSSAAAQEAAWQLLRALLVDFTVSLSGLARQLERTTGAASGRQYLFRWLNRRAWEPQVLYARLPALWPREWRRARELPLLIDCTILGEQWCVLQVSLPWQRRALPVFRLVVSFRQPEYGQTELLYQALAWLAAHLPGPRARYVLVMDRGFPSHTLLKNLQALGWRYVLRIGSHWTMAHPEYRGRCGAVGARKAAGERWSHWFGSAVLGRRQKGRDAWSRTHVVVLADPEQQEVWVLATSETCAAAAIRLYRQRMQIEAEFRDLKGATGLDHLQEWEDVDRVARLLAWIAVYEWRLACLWLRHQPAAWGRTRLQIGGTLSWITITRAWAKYHLRAAVGPRTLVREAP